MCSCSSASCKPGRIPPRSRGRAEGSQLWAGPGAPPSGGLPVCPTCQVLQGRQNGGLGRDLAKQRGMSCVAIRAGGTAQAKALRQKGCRGEDANTRAPPPPTPSIPAPDTNTPSALSVRGYYPPSQPGTASARATPQGPVKVSSGLDWRLGLSLLGQVTRLPQHR